jgi:putative endonuclease
MNLNIDDKTTNGKFLNKAKGDEGEAVAAEFLEKIGYRIIKKNFRKGRNEIDIIAENESGNLNFIEVKTRYKSRFGKPYEAVNKRKLSTIIDVSNFFLMQSSASNIKYDNKTIYYGVISIEYIERRSIKLIFFENILE